MHTPPPILVVDDAPEAREIMALRLQREGCDVVSLSTAKAYGGDAHGHRDHLCDPIAICAHRPGRRPLRLAREAGR